MAVLTVIVEKRQKLGSRMSRTCDHNIRYKCVLISLFSCYCGALQEAAVASEGPSTFPAIFSNTGSGFLLSRDANALVICMCICTF